MGNSLKSKKNEIKNAYSLESWHYDGKISKLIIYKKNTYIRPMYSLMGKIYLKFINGKRIIEIKENLISKYEFYGEETSYEQEQGNIIMHFQIANKDDIKLNNISLIKQSNGIGQLKGDKIKMKNEHNAFIDAYLELNLYNHKENNYLFKINNSNLELSKAIDKKNPKEILENSLCGMKNLINTCYINSSFQILIHIPEFIEIIRKNDDFQENIIEEINKIYNKILEIYKEYRPVINPKSFVKFFKSNHSQYNNYCQMDSEMFLEELLWDINIELGNLRERRTNNPKNEKTEKTLKEKNFYDYLEKSELETNFQINDLFYVYFVHEKKCENCKYITYYYDEIPGLKLNFKNAKFQYQYQYTIDLNTLIIDNFKDPTIYKSNILCQNCQQSPTIIESTRIAKLPKILICSLQKANNENTQKIPWKVEYKFDKEIGIREIVDIDLIKDNSCRYELFAINNHSGISPRAGHYYSQIFLKKLNSWYCFNDESVDKYLDLRPNLNNYILFYRQKEK